MACRAGKINGVNGDGSVNVTVFHDAVLDCFNRGMTPIFQRHDVPIEAEEPAKRTLGEHVCVLLPISKTITLIDPSGKEPSQTITVNR